MSPKRKTPTATPQAKPERHGTLPMQLQLGDRFTDEEGEWEIVAHPWDNARLGLLGPACAPSTPHSSAATINSLLSVPWKKMLFPSTKGGAFVRFPQPGLVRPVPSL